MRRVVMLVGLCAVAALAGCRGSDPEPDCGPPPVEWSVDMQAVAGGQNRFALDLYAKIAADEMGKNVFFSPYCAHTALAMTATGAKSNTREQMLKALHLPEARVPVSGDLGRYYAQPRQDFELSVANALWGQKGFPWRPEWLATQNERFGAGFHEADFAANYEGERQRINKWVEEKTRDKIKDLLLPDQVTKDTTMVLANAIYFKGKWAEQFDPKRTRGAPFQCDDGTTPEVPMMHAKVKCRTAFVDGVWAAELPYRGGELAMLIVLPKKDEKLAELEKRLSSELFAKWVGSLHDHGDLPLSVPKFKLETRYELPGYLKALGMIDAFGDGVADFTGMAEGPPGYISAVAHKAFVDVNEEGTEAAAATAVVVQTVSAPIPFQANRPFLFFIRDAKHGTILFAGRYLKP